MYIQTKVLDGSISKYDDNTVFLELFAIYIDLFMLTQFHAILIALPLVAC